VYPSKVYVIHQLVLAHLSYWGRAMAMAPNKKTAAAIGAVREQILKKPSRVLSTRKTTRVQVNNVRMLCRPEKADELRQELLEAAKQIEDGQDWKKIAEKIGSNDKWGVFSHGGAREGSGRRSSSAIGGIVDSGAAGQHISVSSSAVSSSAIGGVAANIAAIRRRVRISKEPALL
jgi:hypothetical protein